MKSKLERALENMGEDLRVNFSDLNDGGCGVVAYYTAFYFHIETNNMMFMLDSISSTCGWNKDFRRSQIPGIKKLIKTHADLYFQQCNYYTPVNFIKSKLSKFKDICLINLLIL